MPGKLAMLLEFIVPSSGAVGIGDERSGTDTIHCRVSLRIGIQGEEKLENHRSLLNIFQ